MFIKGRTFTAFMLSVFCASLQAQKTTSWSTYNGNLAGQHYSSLHQINSSNVKTLEVVWMFHTGVFKTPGAANSRAAFEANPVLWQNTLYLTTPFDEVFALDAKTGTKLWSYDPRIDRNAFINVVASRGVALWHSTSRSYLRTTCSNRVFLATVDARLVALDATSGKPCESFGDHGAIDLARDFHLGKLKWWYECTSPPTVVGNVVVVGSSISDNQAVEEPSGEVRGFDARSGKLLWSWEPLPWAQSEHPRTGAANTWSVIAADPKRGLIYVPTGSASPDFYGGHRPGDNKDADSIVALKASTGQRVWGFQIVHHDLWDYDIAAEPVLFQFRRRIPAIAIATKTGMVFVFNRLTGEPLYPVYERPVPQSQIPGEETSPTQPFSSLPMLTPLTLTANQVSGETEKDRRFCHDKIAALINRGIFTPISIRTTLLYPGSVGGVEWGSPAINPTTGIMYVNVNNIPFDARLIPRAETGPDLSARIKRKLSKWAAYWDNSPVFPADQRFRAPDTAGHELSTQMGTPYLIFREPLVGPDGLPCSPPPWNTMVAMDLNAGKEVWTISIGSTGAGKPTAVVSAGGPIVTRGSVIFSASTADPYLRAYDPASGRELWRGKLPAAAQSTPMTYRIGRRQYVVICAGGTAPVSGQPGDAVVAFALPEMADDHQLKPVHR